MQTGSRFVCDLGLDHAYALCGINEENKLFLSATYQADAKTGPRHLVVHPETKLVYVFTELSSELHVVDFSNDDVKLIEKVSHYLKVLTLKKWGCGNSFVKMMEDSFMFPIVGMIRFLYLIRVKHLNKMFLRKVFNPVISI